MQSEDVSPKLSSSEKNEGQFCLFYDQEKTSLVICKKTVLSCNYQNFEVAFYQVLHEK